MGFSGRDLITINDLTNEEIEAVLDLAQQMNSRLKKNERIDLCKGMDMATLFYEPSTRTRGSFERAMHKLGGNVISFAEAQTTSSAAKGETLADTVRVLESYADIIVVRHPLEGTAKVAADYAGVPVINAGDGGHEHPTQTLTDLYLIRERKKKIKGLTVCLKGDLKYGRTVHSLVYALARLGANIFLWPRTPDLDMPESVLKELHLKYNYTPQKVNPYDLKDMLGEVEVLYISPVKPYTFPLWGGSVPSSSLEITVKEVMGKTDVIYVTRVQTERVKNAAIDQNETNGALVTRELLGGFEKGPLIMHPLPRVNELPSDLDNYPTSAYFEQAAYGVPIRMALTALLLGTSQIEVSENRYSFVSKTPDIKYKETIGIECPNPDCISVSVRERRSIAPQFKMVNRQPLTLRCAYCDHEVYPRYIASSKWHQGILANKKYYEADSFMLGQIKSENLILFNSGIEAEARGFKPSHYVKVHH